MGLICRRYLMTNHGKVSHFNEMTNFVTVRSGSHETYSLELLGQLRPEWRKSPTRLLQQKHEF